MTYRHQLRVRYSECDVQGVVYFANYLMYADDAMEVWLRSESPEGDYRNFGWEMMAVRAAVEWQSSVSIGDLVDIDVGVVRYGTKSYDLGSVLTCEGRPVFSARVTYVSVEPGSLKPIETPDAVKAIFGGVVELNVPTS